MKIAGPEGPAGFPRAFACVDLFVFDRAKIIINLNVPEIHPFDAVGEGCLLGLDKIGFWSR